MISWVETGTDSGCDQYWGDLANKKPRQNEIETQLTMFAPDLVPEDLGHLRSGRPPGELCWGRHQKSAPAFSLLPHLLVAPDMRSCANRGG